MKNYKYDYDSTCFLKKDDPIGTTKYYIKVNLEYIQVSEEVYRVCRSSYDKIRKTEKNKVERTILNFEDIDQSTFFVINKQIEPDYVNQIYIKDIAKKIEQEILRLPKRDKAIATCIFLNELSDRETARLLNIPQTTVTYRKKIIRKIIKEKIKKFCSLTE